MANKNDFTPEEWTKVLESIISDWLDNGSVLEGSLPPAKAVPKLSGIASPAMIAILTAIVVTQFLPFTVGF
jgi:hypothetical protein